MADLPAPRLPDRYSIGFVCSGNICRSPTAEVVLRERAQEADLPIETISSGLGDWHVGNPMDDRSADELRRAGYDPDRHRAQQFARNWYDDVDLILAMDQGHLSALTREMTTGAAGRVRLYGEFDPVAPGAEVPDPYYGGPEGFEEVLTMIERTTDALIPLLREALEEA